MIRTTINKQTFDYPFHEIDSGPISDLNRIYIYIIVMSLRVCLRIKTEMGARMRACDTSLESSWQNKSIYDKYPASRAPHARSARKCVPLTT